MFVCSTIYVTGVTRARRPHKLPDRLVKERLENVASVAVAAASREWAFYSPEPKSQPLFFDPEVSGWIRDPD